MCPTAGPAGTCPASNHSQEAACLQVAANCRHAVRILHSCPHQTASSPAATFPPRGAPKQHSVHSPLHIAHCCFSTGLLTSQRQTASSPAATSQLHCGRQTAAALTRPAAAVRPCPYPGGWALQGQQAAWPTASPPASSATQKKPWQQRMWCFVCQPLWSSNKARQRQAGAMCTCAAEATAIKADTLHHTGMMPALLPQQSKRSTAVQRQRHKQLCSCSHTPVSSMQAQTALPLSCSAVV